MNLKGKIILVDDEQDNLDYNSTILRKDGFEVKTAHNSKETFEILKSYQADILLLDIILKDESGLDILKKIKSEQQYEQLIIVMISGLLKSSDEQAAGLELGANGYITRPVSKREFLARINAFMRQKETVNALQKSEARFRKIIDRNPDAILIVEKDGKIKFANTAAENLFKLSIDVLMKRIFGYPMIIGEHTEINIVRKGQDNLVGEMRTIDIDWDDAESFLTSIRDISDNKKLWYELIKAKDKAEENERLKSSFLANMSHEIRTPMNSIIGFIDLLQDKELSDDKQDMFLAAIRKGSDRLLTTINDIIEISRIESGQLKLNTSQVSLHKTVNSIIELFKADILNKKLEFIIKHDHSGETDLISTDLNKLESILSNLIRNATKFTIEGFIEVGYSIKKSEIEFYVKDTGIGIPEDKVASIFDRFTQVEDDLTRSYQGSGLGLAISKAYCNILGGDINLKSKEGEGSIFTFTIKRNKVSTADIIEDKEKEINKNKVKGNNILVVEDDYSNFEYLRVLLSNQENNIFWAKNGYEALDLCKENENIDLILMDIRLPGIDGLKATKQIKEFNHSIPIIAQTAYALSGDREKAIEAGCDDYITKPIKKDDLLKLMNRYLT